MANHNQGYSCWSVEGGEEKPKANAQLEGVRFLDFLNEAELVLDWSNDWHCSIGFENLNAEEVADKLDRLSEFIRRSHYKGVI